MRQVVKASHAMTTNSKKEPRVREFFYALFHVGQSSEALIAEGQYIQTVPNCAWRGALATLDIIILSVLEIQIIFHSIAMVEKAVQAKAFGCYSTKTFIGYTLRKISKA